MKKKQKAAFKPVSRKQMRKEARLEKKKKRVEFYEKKKEVKKPGAFVKAPKEGSVDLQMKHQQNKGVNQPKGEKKVTFPGDIKEEHEERKLAKQMKQQRIRSLKKANQEEDKIIKRLEKQLKLNRRKTKTIPKSFVASGLDYLLDVCDPEKVQAAVNAEKNLQESGSEFEEDLDVVRGKENREKKKKMKNQRGKREEEALESESDSEREESEEGSELSGEDDDFLEWQSGEDEEAPQESSSKKGRIERPKRPRPIDKLEERLRKKTKRETENKVELDESESGLSNQEDGVYDSEGPSEVGSDVFDEGTHPGKDNRKDDKSGQWEDIYGRLRDKDGSVIQNNTSKYIPPHLRQKDSSEDGKRREELERLRKQLKGLLNRLAENNMHSISTQIEELYMGHSRHDMNETLYKLFSDALLAPVLTPERLVMEHAMLVALLHANVATEVGAFFLQKLGKQFEEMLREHFEIENKLFDNLIQFISHLYTFKIFHCSLLYEILNKLCEEFNEKHIDLILVVLRSVGFMLRKDDPEALKELILKIQKLAAHTQQVKENSRVKFMLEVLVSIKNNNMHKIPQYDPSHSEHLRKIIKAMFRKGNYVTEMKISLDDLIKADERGRWWVVGSAWTGPSPQNIKNGDASTNSDAGFTREILDLARKHRMNTTTRKNIFCILMTAEDYLDAFEKLLHLGLKGQPEQEIIHVLIHCLLQESKFNPYYAHVANQLCISNRRHQLAIQFAVWDRFKELQNMSPGDISHMAKFLAHLFIEKALPISILKVIDFTEMNKPCVRLLRQILLTLLMTPDDESLFAVFSRVSKPSKLKMFRESLRLFIHHFVLKNIKEDDETGEQLKRRIFLIEQALSPSQDF